MSENGHRFFTDRVVERFRDTAIVSWALIGLLGLIYLVARAIGEVGIVFRPFFFALVIMFLLKPILEFLENKGMNRTMALALSYLVFFTILGIVVGFLVPVIRNEINGLINAFPGYARDVNNYVVSLQNTVEGYRLPAQAAKAIDGALANAQATTLSVLQLAPGYTMSFLSLMLDFVLAPLIAFFLLKDRAEISRGFFRHVPKAWRPEAKYLAYRLNRVTQGVVYVMFVLAVFVSILATLGLVIAGVPYALLLGFVCGFLQIIPYIGPIAGTIPAIIVAWVTHGGWAALGVGIYFTVLTQLASLVFTPIMMKDRVGVHPVLVIFVLLLLGSLFGFWGVALAVPASAIINEIGVFALMTDTERLQAIRDAGIAVD